MEFAKLSARSGGRLFISALVLAVIGGAAFFVGLGAAFSRAGNWSNGLATFGIGLLCAGGIVNVAAVVLGLRAMLASRTLLWWWIPSAALAAASVGGGVVVLSL